MKMIKIEINERKSKKHNASFDLIVDGEKILEDTGINNCTKEVFPTYCRRIRELNKDAHIK